MHMNVMVASDFFGKTIWAPLGRKTAYVLVFIHLGSRKVFMSASTYNPPGEWLQQQAGNVSMWAQDEGIDVRFLICDRDAKFTEAFDAHFRRDDGGIVRTPVQSPIANCYSESWIGSLKRECLNQFFCFGLRQLDHIVQTYTEYYNEYRPHQGLANRPPGVSRDPPALPENDHGSILCRPWLGGLLKHYYRKAA